MKWTLISLFLWTSASFGQINFLKSYGNNGYDVGKDVKVDIDSGYVVTGGSSSFSSNEANAFILKVDSLGNFLWSNNYGGSGSDWGEKIIMTNENGYAVGGYTNSIGSGGFDFYLFKTDPSGNMLWQKSYGGSDWDKAYGLAQLADSGYVLVGETQSYGSGNSDMLIIRTDKFGDTIWTQTYGGAGDDIANDVIADGDSIIVVGSTNSFGSGMRDGFIRKYHIDGNLGWSQVIGKSSDDYFTCIEKTISSNEYFIGGSRDYNQTTPSDIGDFWVYNISADGNTLFADTTIIAAGHELEIIHDITSDDADNCFFAGETRSFGYSNIDFQADAYAGKLLNNYYWAYNFANRVG